MKGLQQTLKEITQLTATIEANYAELYRYLGENPMTLPVAEHPRMDEKIMQDYLESLQQLLKHHLDTHKKIKTTF